MRTSQKGFTLVELIVVITILAILGTIAFISLQGYSQDARNATTTQNLNNLVSAINTASLNTSIIDMIDTTANARNLTDQTVDYTIWGTQYTLAAILADATADVTFNSDYETGRADGIALGQNIDELKDANGRDFFVGGFVYTFRDDNDSSNNESRAMYQVAGQLTNEANQNIALVRGNFVRGGAADDMTGLFESTTAGDILTNDEFLWTTSLY